MKELEIEKRTLKSRLEQVEQELYKANKEKVSVFAKSQMAIQNEAIKARDAIILELAALKKQKEELEKQTNDGGQLLTSLKIENEGIQQGSL